VKIETQKVEKVKIITYHHIDSIISLSCALSKSFEVDLTMVFAQNSKKASIINFENIAVKNGFANDDSVKNILGNEVYEYCEGFKTNVFINHNLKAYSIKNLFLTAKLFLSTLKSDIIIINGQDGTLLQLIFFNLFFRKKHIYLVHDYFPHTGDKLTVFIKMLRVYFLNSRHPIVLQNKQDFLQALGDKTFKTNKMNYISFGQLDIYKSYIGKSSLQKNELQSDILFYGRISPYKGINFLIEAGKIMLKKMPDIIITIAGSGSFDFDISPFLNHPNFRIINSYLSNGDVADLLNNTKIVVCPYTDATQSGVAMAAFAFNKPLVASNVGVFKEVVIDGKTGFLVPPKNASELADRLLKILSNKELLDEMGKNIEEFNKTSEFAWDTIAENYLSLVNQTIG
jgi:glycosyltransferase involved in cell wall biosynthesis